MITDGNLILSGSYTGGVWTGQSIAQAVGTYVSTNVIDLASMSPNQGQDYGAGEDLIALFNIVTAVTTGTSSNVQFQIVQADDAGITTNINVINQTDALLYSLLGVGAYVKLKLTPSSPNIPRRYLAARYVISGATTTAGAVVAQIVHDADDIILLGKNAYKSGFSVI